MKKIGLLFGLLFMVSLTFAQVTQLKETTVESPKFIGQQIDYDYEGDLTASPICHYLKNNLKNENYLDEGIVTVLFTINADGTLSDFNITNSVSSNNDNAVLNCIKSTSGLWQAGKVDGKPVEMQKEIYVHFVNPSTKSLETLAQDNILSAIKKIESAKTTRRSVNLSAKKANRKADNKLYSALFYLNEANKYQPEEPSVVFWQACAYEELGDEINKTEKLNQFLELTDLQYQAQIESVNILLN